MEDRRIDFEMRAHYRGNLTQELRKDQRRLAAFQRMLDKRPLLVPVRLDVSGAQAQARMLGEALRSELAKVGAPQILAPGGGLARAELQRTAGRLSSAITTTFAKDGKTISSEIERTIDQIGAGVTRASAVNLRTGRLLSITDKDVSTVEDLNRSLRQASVLGANYAKARKVGDLAGQRAALEEQIRAIGGKGGILAEAASRGLENAPIYQRAEARLGRLRERLAALSGAEETAEARALRGRRQARFERFDTGQQRRTQAALTENRQQLELARQISDRAAREARVNDLLAQRRGILERHQGIYQRLEPAMRRLGEEGLAGRAYRRTLGAGHALGASDLDATRRQTKAAMDARTEAQRALHQSRQDRFERFDKLQQRRTQAALTENQRQIAAAGAIADPSAREARVNSLLNERSAILQRHHGIYQRLEPAMRRLGEEGLGDRAFRRRLSGRHAMDMDELDRTRRTTKQALDARAEAEKAAQAASKERYRRFDEGQQARTAAKLKGNAAAIARTETIADPTAREARVNSLLDERRAILERNRGIYERLAQARRDSGDDAQAAAAGTRATQAQTALEGHELERAKREGAAAKTQRAKNLADAKRDAARMRADRQMELERDISAETARTRRTVAGINAAERQALAKSRTSEAKRQVRRDAADTRRQAFQRSASTLQGIGTTAIVEGYGKTALKAQQAATSAAVRGTNEMNRFAKATTAGGHALDFHSNQLLRNAMTFAKWYGPMQVVLSAIRAISAGFSGMANVDRQFAIMRAVFRGTSEEAQKLKDGTLALAVANGRSADEAMDASIRFSRLGLTRLQVLKATEVALMAANVAEVDAAYAAEKLSSIYAAYKLTVDDLPAVLGRLNAISNRYNVTNKDMLEGISRVAGAARNVGLELDQLPGIIASVVGATGRPGQEVGNALKTIIPRIAKPETISKLRDMFDMDITLPTGDLKDYYAILQQMAEAFPKMSRYQQQLFLYLVAGSRQSERFVQILQEFTTAQYLNAQAGLDVNSALSENEQIVSSLSSRVDALKAAWTDLFVKIGDTGVLDNLANALDVVTEAIERASQAGRPGGDQRKPGDTVRIENRRMRRFLRNISGRWQPFGGDVDVPTYEIENAIAQVRAADALRRNITREDYKRFLSTPLRPSSDAAKAAIRAARDAGISDQNIVATIKEILKGSRKVFLGSSALSDLSAGIELGPDESLTDVAPSLESLVNTKESTLKVNAVSRISQELKSLVSARDSFSELSRRISGGKGTFDETKALRDFENLSKLALSVPQGTTFFSKNYGATREAIKSGGGAAELRAWENLFATRIPETERKLSITKTDRLGVLKQAAEEVDARKLSITEAIGKATDRGAIKELEKDFTNATGEAKQLADAIAQVENAVGELREQPGLSDEEKHAYNLALERTVARVDDLKKRLSGLLDAEQPLGRRMAHDLRLIDQPKAEAAAEVERRRKELRALEIQQDGIAKRREDYLKLGATREPLATEIPKARDRLTKAQVFGEEQRKKAEQERQAYEDTFAARQVEDAFARGGREQAVTQARGLVGLTEGERLINQSRFLLGRAGRELELPEAMGTGPADRAERLARLLTDEGRVRQNLLDLEGRQAQLGAERETIELRIQEAQRRQTEEAGRRLAMASREDQLRAAALARTLRDTGPLSTDEFFYLSQESRQATANYLPSGLPQNLNEEIVAIRKEGEEMAKETALITATIGNLRRALASLETGITSEMGEGGSLDVVPTGGPEATAVTAPVTINSMDIQVKIADELIEVVRSATYQEVRSQMGRFWSLLQPAAGSAPPTGGANSATGT